MKIIWGEALSTPKEHRSFVELREVILINTQFCVASLHANQEIALQGLLAKGSHISTQWTPNGVTYKNLGAAGHEK